MSWCGRATQSRLIHVVVTGLVGLSVNLLKAIYLPIYVPVLSILSIYLSMYIHMYIIFQRPLNEEGQYELKKSQHFCHLKVRVPKRSAAAARPRDLNKSFGLGFRVRV